MRLRGMALVLTAGLLAGAGLAACSSDDGAEGVGETAMAAMAGADGAAMGTVTMEQGPNGVLISADVSGLAPGAHGFHIHDAGACTPDFSAAGSHFSPSGHGHGFMYGDDQHAGDLPNLYAAGDGTARADVFTNKITLAADADTTVFDDDGSAIIIHAGPDSYGAEPGAGDRVACGVIERS